MAVSAPIVHLALLARIICRTHYWPCSMIVLTRYTANLTFACMTMQSNDDHDRQSPDRDYDEQPQTWLPLHFNENGEPLQLEYLERFTLDVAV